VIVVCAFQALQVIAAAKQKLFVDFPNIVVDVSSDKSTTSATHSKTTKKIHQLI